MSEVINMRYLIHLELKGPRAVLDWCMERGLMASERICAECGAKMFLMARAERSEGFDWHCRKTGHNAHRSKVSVRDGSVFSGGKVPLMRMISLMYCWAWQFDVADAVRECSVNRVTVTEWERSCREAVVEDLAKRKDVKQIGGKGVVVEVDEWDFGQGLGGATKWLYSGIERKNPNRNFFAVAEERSREALLSVVKDCIRPGSQVASACWKSHDCQDYEGFSYLSQHYEMEFVEMEDNDDESAWGDLRKNLDIADDHVDFLVHVWRKRHAKSQDMFAELIKTVQRVYSANYNNQSGESSD